jgi:hypothetical protein
MRRLPLFAVAAVVALAGCTDDDPAADDPAADDSSSDGTDSTDEASGGSEDGSGELEFARCEGEDLSVDYPASWTVYEDDVVPSCHVFHPEPITDYQGESLHYAVRLYIDPVAFKDATGSGLGEELSREETTVDGRDAVLIERRSEGESLLPEGERSYTYTVDLDGEILVAMTSTVGDTDHERDRRILDHMMDSITIHAEG